MCLIHIVRILDVEIFCFYIFIGGSTDSRTYGGSPHYYASQVNFEIFCLYIFTGGSTIKRTVGGSPYYYVSQDNFIKRSKG